MPALFATYEGRGPHTLDAQAVGGPCGSASLFPLSLVRRTLKISTRASGSGGNAVDLPTSLQQQRAVFMRMTQHCCQQHAVHGITAVTSGLLVLTSCSSAVAVA